MLDFNLLNSTPDVNCRPFIGRQMRCISEKCEDLSSRERGRLARFRNHTGGTSVLLWFAICLVLSAVSTAFADVRLSPLFSDGAVLQRGREVPIWGMADPGESVAVRMNGKEASGTADGSGRWSVQLPAQDVGGPFDLTVQGNNTVVLHDVVVGEVWVASGQSNMQFPLMGVHGVSPRFLDF